MLIWPDGDLTYLTPIDSVILEIDKVDPGGDAFRYRTDKHGNVHLESLPRVLSLEHFSKLCTQAIELLDGAHDGIREMLDGRLEILGESQNEYG